MTTIFYSEQNPAVSAFGREIIVIRLMIFSFSIPVPEDQQLSWMCGLNSYMAEITGIFIIPI